MSTQNTAQPRPMLKQVIRRKRRIARQIGGREVAAYVTMPIGVLIAKPVDRKDDTPLIYVGVSKVNEAAGDVFCEHDGDTEAHKRIQKALNGEKVTAPLSTYDDVKKFVNRCKRYYKGCQVYPVHFEFKERMEITTANPVTLS
jgi:hypothetical protein